MNWLVNPSGNRAGYVAGTRLASHASARKIRTEPSQTFKSLQEPVGEANIEREERRTATSNPSPQSAVKGSARTNRKLGDVA